MKEFKSRFRTFLYLTPLAVFFGIMGCAGSSGGGGCGQQGGQVSCGAGTHSVTDSSGNSQCVPNT